MAMRVFAIIGIVTVSVWALFMIYVGWHLIYNRIYRRRRKHFKCVTRFSEAPTSSTGNTERVTVR